MPRRCCGISHPSCPAPPLPLPLPPPLLQARLDFNLHNLSPCKGLGGTERRSRELPKGQAGGVGSGGRRRWRPRRGRGREPSRALGADNFCTPPAAGVSAVSSSGGQEKAEDNKKAGCGSA